MSMQRRLLALTAAGVASCLQGAFAIELSQEVTYPEQDDAGHDGDASVDFRYTVEVPSCSDHCGEGTGDPELRCGLFKGEDFWRHVAADKCASKKQPWFWKSQGKCYGDKPITEFCMSCSADGVAPCAQCAPGFERDGLRCRNAALQVLLEVSARGYLHTAWQVAWRPKLADCLADVIGSFGDDDEGAKLPVNVYSVLPRPVEEPRRDSHIVIRANVPVPQGASATELSDFILGKDFAKLSQSLEGRCPQLERLDSVSVLCPGGLELLSDGSCFGPAELANARKSVPLLYWDVAGVILTSCAVLAYVGLERRRWARELEFAEAATNHAKTSAHVKETQLASLAKQQAHKEPQLLSA